MPIAICTNCGNNQYWIPIEGIKLSQINCGACGGKLRAQTKEEARKFQVKRRVETQLRRGDTKMTPTLAKLISKAVNIELGKLYYMFMDEEVSLEVLALVCGENNQLFEVLEKKRDIMQYKSV